MNSGCVTHYRAKAIETKLLVLESKFQQLKSDFDDNKESQNATLENISTRFDRFNKDILTAIDRLRKGSAEDIGDIEALRDLVTRQQGELSRLNFELENLKNDKAVQTQKQKFPEDKEQLYQRAEQLLIEKSYSDAVRFYNEFVKRYPNDVRADDSLYHIAEAYYQQRQFNESVIAIKQIIEEYPNENQADKALILLHDAYVAMSKCSKARSALEYLKERYPRSNQKRNATRKLERLKCK